jgi:hypothetical protein
MEAGTQVVTVQDIEACKAQGNEAFSKNNYPKAIQFYEEGIRRAKAFSREYEGALEFKSDFGDHSNPD